MASKYAELEEVSIDKERLAHDGYYLLPRSTRETERLIVHSSACLQNEDSGQAVHVLSSPQLIDNGYERFVVEVPHAKV